jgi:hypothetical protein
VDAEDMVKTSVDALVTETTLDPELSPDLVVTLLRVRKTTGQLVFHLSQGGIQKIALVERTKAEGPKAEKIRGILGMS